MPDTEDFPAVTPGLTTCAAHADLLKKVGGCLTTADFLKIVGLLVLVFGIAGGVFFSTAASADGLKSAEDKIARNERDVRDLKSDLLDELRLLRAEISESRKATP